MVVLPTHEPTHMAVVQLGPKGMVAVTHVRFISYATHKLSCSGDVPHVNPVLGPVATKEAQTSTSNADTCDGAD